MNKAKKSLGQHWLNDEESLQAVVEMGQVSAGDTVLEIGPGHGSLTEQLLAAGAEVVAVEFDVDLAASLADKLGNPEKLEVINQDALLFDLGYMSEDYKIVANIPYYLSGKLIRKILDSTSLPTMTSLLVQKEVAERFAAMPGSSSILTVFTQHYFDVQLGRVVEAELFEPSPKVDSQIVGLKRKDEIEEIDINCFKRVVKAGFSARRKKLVNNLSGGLRIEKQIVTEAVINMGVNETARAQELSQGQWYALTRALTVE